MGIELTEEQMELIERRDLIEEIKSLGKNYKFDKYTTKQLWHIRNKVRLMIAKEEAEYLKEAREYYKKKEMGIPNYIQDANGIFYVWNEGDLEYQPLESTVDLEEVVKQKTKKRFTDNIMNRFTKLN